MTRGLSLLLLLLSAVAVHAGASCPRSCATLQRNCLAFARAALAQARPACTGDAARACRQTARHAFKDDAAACRHAAAACRPCCRLGGVNECARQRGVPLAEGPQQVGDPVHGRELLLAGDYMTCGIPYKVWQVAPGLIADGFGSPATAPRIADRPGRNADLPYFLNEFTTPEGADVVSGNCLMCHGGTFDGQLVVGLGNATADFTAGAGGGATSVPVDDALLDALGLDDAERGQLRKIAARGAVLGARTHMRTIGMNPAEMFAVILMVHHDRDTLAWSDTEVTPLTVVDGDGRPIADPRVTSDPPPWWRVHKKHEIGRASCRERV